ncbi:MAG TPA: fasciclin domain-containing protein [Bryobacteraceae bacterium]|nr:fasciclin domain-containing protein [Bryobacteraceae bacterium]
MTSSIRQPRIRRLNTFVEKVRAGGLEGVLHGPDLVTVLAPNNGAFAGREQSLGFEGKYILRGSATAAELRMSGSIKSLNGTIVRFAGSNGEIKVGRARLVRPDIECTNGVLHIIDLLID